jgi:hypothetical protein
MAALYDHIHGDSSIAYIIGITTLSIIHYKHGHTAHSAFGILV